MFHTFNWYQVDHQTHENTGILYICIQYTYDFFIMFAIVFICVYYSYLEPNLPLFLKVTLSNNACSNQSQSIWTLLERHGSSCICKYIYIIIRIIVTIINNNNNNNNNNINNNYYYYVLYIVYLVYYICAHIAYTHKL